MLVLQRRSLSVLSRSELAISAFNSRSIAGVTGIRDLRTPVLLSMLSMCDWPEMIVLRRSVRKAGGVRPLVRCAVRSPER